MAKQTKKVSSGKKIVAGKKMGAGRTPATGGTLSATAKVVGRTLGRAARGIDGVAAAVNKVTAPKRVAKKAKKDPAAKVQQAKKRESWKAREAEVNAVELAKRGALVDERARVRANVGMSWSNRKPR